MFQYKELTGFTQNRDYWRAALIFENRILRMGSGKGFTMRNFIIFTNIKGKPGKVK
jgi:hypothetical protein